MLNVIVAMTVRMMGYVLLPFLVSLVCAQNDPGKEAAIGTIFTKNPGFAIPPGSEVAPGKTLDGFGALERCGEGTQRGLKVCVPYHRCDPATNTVTPDEVNTDGAGIIDIRAGVNECESYLDVCCNLPSGDTVNATTAKPDTPTTPPPVKESFCGIRNEGGIDFKITGNDNNEAEYGEFPWMVAVLKTNYNPAVDKILAICGGSLIAPSVVLTGAHCVYQRKIADIKVRAGEWDTQTTKERLPYQERAVQNIIVHPNFKPETLFNDFALLILDVPVTKADNVGTICLPPQGQQFFSKNCFASGWGKTEFGATGAYSVILKKIELPIVQKTECQVALRKTRLGTHFNLDKSFICAGGEEGKDTCTGDGGSPLVCPDPNNPGRYQQAGLVAWGIGCGDKEVPGVYGDVAAFRNWIDEQMTRLNLDTKPYNI